MRASAGLPALSLRGGEGRAITRTLPEEAAVAMVYNGGTQAVMMATPADLEDLAVGFSLSERVIAHPAEIEALEVAEQENGVELRMWLGPDRAEALARRRRFMAGPVGCGLCGIDSLEEAQPPLPVVAAAGPRLSGADIEAAVAALATWQPLRRQTGAVHAAAFWTPAEGATFGREDVGRHNALDKLIGALARAGRPASAGAVVMTSRISVELVQKCALAGAPILIALSAPTAQAVRLAAAAGVTLVGAARGGGCEVFTRPDRIAEGRSSDVA